MSERAVLRVEQQAGTWKLVGSGAERFVLVNDYLGYLADRNYSAQTVRAYALDLLQFARWLEGEGLGLAEVTTEVMLGFLAVCRAAVLPGRPGGNVFSIRDGRNAGYAPATINRRLAAVSGLFAFWGLRDPAAPNPVPRGREARGVARGQRTGLLAHVGKPRPRSRLRVREPRRLPRGLDRVEAQALLASFRSWRDRAMAGLMLLSGLRSAEVLGLTVQDVDVGRRWVRVVGKGDRERRVPVDPEVVGAIQAYLLAERPATDSTRLFVVAKGPTRGQPLTPAGLRTVFRYHRWRAGVPAGHPHALRHSFGTALAEAGVDLAVIQALMATTMWTRPPPTSTSPPLTCEPSSMLPAPASALGPEPDLLGAYAAYLAATGRSGRLALAAAGRFVARWPDPQAWAAEPLEVRLGAGQTVRPLLTFLMLQGHLRPGYDYLVARKLPTLWRELPHSPLATDLDRFAATATLLGFTQRVCSGIGSQVIARLLIQTGRPLERLTQADFDELAAACAQRTTRTGKGWRHYSSALHAGRQVLYHLGVLPEPPVNPNRRLRQSFQRRMAGVPEALGDLLVAYLERLTGTHARSTVTGTATRLAHFGRHLAAVDPELSCLSGLDRRRHIESYLAAVAAARSGRDGAPLSASERRARVLAVSCLLNDICEWGWPQAPPRRLLFRADIPKLPRPLPRYLPPDADRRLAAALHASPNRLPADALLLQRACGLRIGELCDLELDCVHELAGQGAWLKVPLGKLATERMLPLDEETVTLVDRIVTHRAPGRPLRHPRSGRPVEFLLTHHGKRLSPEALRAELARAASKAGLEHVTPHQLRHTYATALVNAGVSLQSLMVLLGHVSAEMSLRYGRLFDQTVRAEYERALTLAKQQLGPVLPSASPVTLTTDWRQAPAIKARLAGGFCVRAEAQGHCPYANICEHCPNFRTDATYLPVLAAQRVDAEALAADAQARGWVAEAERHHRLIERLDLLMSQARTG